MGRWGYGIWPVHYGTGLEVALQVREIGSMDRGLILFMVYL